MRPHSSQFRWIPLVMATCCVLPSSILAQTSALPPAKPASGLPTTIRLVKRGKVGDYYRIQLSTKFEANMNTDAKLNSHDSASDADKGFHQANVGSESANYVVTDRVRSVSKQGKIAVEETEAKHQVSKVDNGKRSTEMEPVKSKLITYGPNSAILETKELPASSQKQSDPGSLDVIFPDRALSIGDSWEGKMPFALDKKSPAMVPYTARLASIEKHLGIPCAQVECTLDIGHAFQESIIKSMSAKAPADGQQKFAGEPKTTSKVTIFYSLDRGTVIEIRVAILVDLDMTATLSSAGSNATVEVSLKGKLEMNVNGIAVQHPTFDPALVPAVKASKPNATP